MEKAKEKRPRTRKGYWFETAPNGEKLYCVRGRLNGKTVEVKKSVAEIVREAAN